MPATSTQTRRSQVASSAGGDAETPASRQAAASRASTSAEIMRGGDEATADADSAQAATASEAARGGAP